MQACRKISLEEAKEKKKRSVRVPSEARHTPRTGHSRIYKRERSARTTRPRVTKIRFERETSVYLPARVFRYTRNPVIARSIDFSFRRYIKHENASRYEKEGGKGMGVGGCRPLRIPRIRIKLYGNPDNTFPSPLAPSSAAVAAAAVAVDIVFSPLNTRGYTRVNNIRRLAVMDIK